MRKKAVILIFVITLFFSVFYTVNLVSLAEDFHTEDSSVFGEEDSFANLNYGFYYAKRDNLYEKVVPGEENEAFDNNKPTMIFVHGYQSNSGYFRRETLACNDNNLLRAEDSHNFADLWIDKGYNVLVYQWNQFCDEPSPFLAESKMWSAEGPRKMRWRKSDGSYTAVDDPSNPVEPVTVSFIRDYLKIVQNNNGQEIRLVGHSMGGMFSVISMGILYEKYQNGEINIDKIPMRLSLLDPWLGVSGYVSADMLTLPWKKTDDPFKTVRQSDTTLVCKDYLEKLHNTGVAIDYYIGTVTGQFGLMVNQNNPKDSDISPNVALINIDLSGITEGLPFTSAVGKQHISARDYYFYSINFDKVALSDDSGNCLITATTPSTEVYACSGRSFTTTEPVNNLVPTDDIYIETESDFFTEVTHKGTVSGFIYNDLNHNGLRDDGANLGFSEITVKLYDSNDKLVGSAKTDDLGFYSIEHNAAGSYYLVFNKVNGGEFSEIKEGTFTDLISSTDAEGKTQLFTVDMASEDFFVNSGQYKRDLLSNGYIIIYFASGIILVLGLSIVFYLKAVRKEQETIEENI